MRASEISTIVDCLVKKSSPYRCILIDGKWGIGKTFEVKQAIESIPGTIYVSLFGIKDSQQMYQDILVQMSGSGALKKLSPLIQKDTIKELSKKNVLTSVIASITTPKNIFELCGKGENSERLYVFDDLERMNVAFGIEEFLGIVESIKNEKKAKILMVANSENMEGDNKSRFEKYSEKVIDRVYSITDVSEHFMDGDPRFDNDFVRAFFDQHKLKNLRTLQKAQQFYEDVCLCIADMVEQNEEYLEYIRLMCFSIVVESIDHIYKNAPLEEKENDNNDFYKHLLEQDDMRIMLKYISSSISGWGDENLLRSLKEYFDSGEEINADIVLARYNVYLQSGEKHNFYKSQPEIEQMISQLTADISSNEMGDIQMLEKANTVVAWMGILGEDTHPLLLTVEDRLYTSLMSKCEYRDSKKGLPYEQLFDAVTIEYPELKSILVRVKDRVINDYWDGLYLLCNNAVAQGDYALARLLMNKIEDASGYPEYQYKIPEVVSKLLIPEVLPIGSIDEDMYAFFGKLCKIANKVIHDDTKAYLQQSLDSHPNDAILAHRVKLLREQNGI